VHFGFLSLEIFPGKKTKSKSGQAQYLLEREKGSGLAIQHFELEGVTVSVLRKYKGKR